MLKFWLFIGSTRKYTIMKNNGQQNMKIKEKKGDAQQNCPYKSLKIY
jgi:hypothetical protein